MLKATVAGAAILAVLAAGPRESNPLLKKKPPTAEQRAEALEARIRALDDCDEETLRQIAAKAMRRIDKLERELAAAEEDVISLAAKADSYAIRIERAQRREKKLEVELAQAAARNAPQQQNGDAVGEAGEMPPLVRKYFVKTRSTRLKRRNEIWAQIDERKRGLQKREIFVGGHESIRNSIAVLTRELAEVDSPSYVPPIEELVMGEVGMLKDFEVVQILGDTDMLIRHEGVDAWVAGVSTAGLTDGMGKSEQSSTRPQDRPIGMGRQLGRFESIGTVGAPPTRPDSSLRTGVVAVVGTKTYKTALGTPKTVFLVQALDISPWMR